MLRVSMLAALAVSVALEVLAGQPPDEPVGEPSEAAGAAAESVSSEELEQMLAELDGLAGLPIPEALPVDALEVNPFRPSGSVEDAGRRYEEQGFAPVVALPTHRLYPYGHSVPTLRCVPTRACDLVLEAGEVIDGHAIGDPESWQTTVLLEGRAPGLVPHFVVKPSGFDLATNLVLVTDRRTYHVELISPAEDAARADGAAYDHRIGWWYPQEWSARRRSAEELVRRREEARDRATPDGPSLDPTELNWSYRIEEPWRRSRRLPWQPSAVVDDGERTWIRLPEEAARSELPAVFGVLDDGTFAPLNARYRGGWLLIPAPIDRAELVLGAGDSRRWLRIVRTATSSPTPQ